MWHNYGPKTSIVSARDLQHLIDLNYAADHQLDQPTIDHFIHRPTNQIEAAEDDEELQRELQPSR